jgi:transglutaminase-like putative cysteine protease
LRKIPEIKAAFNKSDVKTIESVEDIVYSILMSKNPELVRKNFDMMLKEGIPEKRKYCTPLQALEWYYVDNEPEKDNLLEYRQLNLERFIMRVWRTTSTSENFTSDRWKNFDEVTDRLNSPDLVSIYMMNNFKYKTDIEVYGAVNYWASAMEMFKIKAGDCEDHAVFATYCLAKNGYPAQGLCIIWEGPGFRGHMTCVYKYPGNPLIYCIDVKGTKHGPFDTYHDVAKFMYMKYPKIGPLESYQPYDIDLLSGKFKPK